MTKKKAEIVKVGKKEIEKLGFDMKLTKDDLFELAYNEAVSRIEAEINALRKQKNEISYEFLDSESQKSLQENAIYKALEGACISQFCGHYVDPENMALVLNIHFNKDDTATGNIRFVFKISDEVVRQYKDAKKSEEDIDNNIRELQCNWERLRCNPRQVKAEMLKKMLSASQEGQDLLSAIKSIKLF